MADATPPIFSMDMDAEEFRAWLLQLTPSQVTKDIICTIVKHQAQLKSTKSKCPLSWAAIRDCFVVIYGKPMEGVSKQNLMTSMQNIYKENSRYSKRADKAGRDLFLKQLYMLPNVIGPRQHSSKIGKSMKKTVPLSMK